MKSYSKPSLLLEDLPRCLVQPVTTLYKSMLVMPPYQHLLKAFLLCTTYRILNWIFMRRVKMTTCFINLCEIFQALSFLVCSFKKGAQELCSTFRSSLSLERIGLTYFVGEKVRHFFAPEEHCSVILFSS